ncbi:hypothetical protein ARALYDRAFT_337006 [Arabidopsis lyrata subsp. lyrata]|uniref:Replication protein A 70 kDa DNA-binding subunit B/D first OB fold domain-containing protein n=2 Tax=Arabidopsis lyrata subsp. lyrata TaxID=81972 RepID=D7KD62_ARALL|nr:hypothetical protein ARALYDRAFT_337006 [Arabidopsis lyrata subsp. lyrata]
MSSRFTSSSIERYNDFSRLNPAIVGWHVHVKVLRRFHTDDYISKGGLGLLLVDDKGNQIEALICSPLTSHYSTFIEEDEFYTIMNFRVVENSGFTKLTRSDFKIMFYDGTIVKEASSFSQDDYTVATPFGAIFNGYHDTSYLITLIGRVVESSDLTNVTDEPSVIGGYRYSFTIEDQEKKTLKCCAYGGVAIECHDRFRNVIGSMESFRCHGWPFDVMTYNRNMFTISSLNPLIHEWSTCVKILHVWHELEDVSNALNLILMDNQGTKIRAVIRESLVTRFSPLLIEGLWMILRKFSLIPDVDLVRTTPHRFKIQFSPDTCVEYLNYLACDYDYFNFARFRDIRTGISNPYICVDLVGKVDNVNDIQLVQMGSGCDDGVLSQFLDVTSDSSCLPDVEENVKEYLDDVSAAVDLSSVLHVEASAAVLSLDEFKDVLSDLGALSVDKDYVLAVLYLESRTQLKSLYLRYLLSRYLQEAKSLDPLMQAKKNYADLRIKYFGDGRFVAAGMKPYPSDGLECDEILMNTNEDTLECINDIVISSWRLCPAYLRLRFVESLILYKSINVHTVWDACYRVLSGDVLAEQKIARNNPGLELSDVQLEWYGFRVMRKVMGDLGFHHAGFEGVRLGIVRRLLTYKCDDMSM